MWPLLVIAAFAQSGRKSPEENLAEAERLAWLRAWARAEPFFVEAEKQFAARGDQRNKLYAEISRLRSQLPRTSLADTSETLTLHLKNPLVQADDRLKLRALVVKGDTDLDYDVVQSEQAWKEAGELAKRLGERAWENRATGELGVIAGIYGDINKALAGITNALKVAEQLDDKASQIRWRAILAIGLTEFGNLDGALQQFDRAIEVGRNVDELRRSLMVDTGKANVLIKLKRNEEAQALLSQALADAKRHEALGYTAEIMRNTAQILVQTGKKQEALALLTEALIYARRAGAQRILAEIYLDLGALQSPVAAARSFKDGISVARRVRERLLLPKLLTRLAMVEASQRRPAAASALLDEATQTLEGLMVGVASPWIRARLIGVMDEVFVARVSLEGETLRRPDRMLAAIEQARGRVLAGLLMGRPMWNTTRPATLLTGERKLTALQSQLWTARTPALRQRILERIFALESELAPASADFFRQTETGRVRTTVSQPEIQGLLRDDETLIEYALAAGTSFCLEITKESAVVHRLPPRPEIRKLVATVLRGVAANREPNVAALTAAILPMRSLKSRVIIVPDDELHRLPFELLLSPNGEMLLRAHTTSYVPSATVLSVLRKPRNTQSTLASLAVSASPPGQVLATNVTRAIDEVDGVKLTPLPSANEEARAVATLVGGKLLVGESATEAEFKRQRLADFGLLHIAAHGVISTKFPERSAIVLRQDPQTAEDGLLQAREILNLRLTAKLVTLSACDTAKGTMYGQEGVASLVRPFLVAGARSVVANLWAANDTFSLALMKEFYRHIADKQDAATALQKAKLELLRRFGPQATPKLWAGFLVHGDGRTKVVPE